MDVDALKDKVIEDFAKLICEIRKGYKPNYQTILEEISFIDLIENNKIDTRLSLIALQYYINGRQKYNSR